MKYIRILASVAIVAAVGCSGKRDSAPAATSDARTVAPAPTDAAPIQDAGGVSGRHRQVEGWIPGEFKRGAAKYRDPVIYLDGKPIGVINFWELPHFMNPVWVDAVEGLDYGPGHAGPKERKTKTPRYRLVEYLEILGVDVAKVRELHIYGGRSFLNPIAGDDVRKFAGEFMFDFASLTRGRIRPRWPDGYEPRTHFDRLYAICIYVDKIPPVRQPDGRVMLHKEVVHGIPYFGEPLRGGVRVYVDYRLALWIKRRTLDKIGKLPPVAGEASPRYSLYDLLREQKVNLDTVTIADMIHKFRHVGRIDGADELEKLWFRANPTASGEILVGPDATQVNSIMLFTKNYPPIEWIDRY